MSVQPFVLRPDQHEPALNVVGTQVAVLASNAATQSYGITLQQGEEGTGPPPHSHDWDEALYVLKGEIHFLTGRNGSDPVLMQTGLHGFKEDVRKIPWESEYPNAWLIEREETSTHEG